MAQLFLLRDYSMCAYRTPRCGLCTERWDCQDPLCLMWHSLGGEDMHSMKWLYIIIKYDAKETPRDNTMSSVSQRNAITEPGLRPAVCNYPTQPQRKQVCGNVCKCLKEDVVPPQEPPKFSPPVPSVVCQGKVQNPLCCQPVTY